MADFAEYSIRIATQGDKEAILNIRQNVYGGRDYLPDYYDDFMTSPNVTPFVLCHQDKIVGFNAAVLVDNAETLVSRAARISPDYEGQNIYGFLDNHVIQWAKTKGVRVKAFTASALNKNIEKTSFKTENQLILSKSHLIYVIVAENINFADKESQLIEKLESVPQELLKACIQSEDRKSYLFPGQRISINSVPYELMESNIPMIMNDTHTTAFSNLDFKSGSCKGLLSFGTLFSVQKFSYQYTVDIYGSDRDSVRLHVLKHLVELKRKATGSVCVLFPFQKELLPEDVDSIFLEFGCKRANKPDSDDLNTWITCDFLFEKTL